MEFTPDEWLSFAKKLEHATEEGRLKWAGEENPFEPESGYYTKTRSGATYLLRSKDYDAQFPFVLSINDTSGQLASFTTVPFADEFGYEPADPSLEQITSSSLGRLYRLVERLVTGAPQKAKLLLSELDSLFEKDDSQDLPF